jgi:hypothetical protein
MRHYCDRPWQMCGLPELGSLYPEPGLVSEFDCSWSCLPRAHFVWPRVTSCVSGMLSSIGPEVGSHDTALWNVCRHDISKQNWRKGYDNRCRLLMYLIITPKQMLWTKNAVYRAMITPWFCLPAIRNPHIRNWATIFVETLLLHLLSAFIIFWEFAPFGITNKKQKQTSWPLVRERTIPTDRPSLVDEI